MSDLPMKGVQGNAWTVSSPQSSFWHIYMLCQVHNMSLCFYCTVASYPNFTYLNIHLSELVRDQRCSDKWGSGEDGCYAFLMSNVSIHGGDVNVGQGVVWWEFSSFYYFDNVPSVLDMRGYLGDKGLKLFSVGPWHPLTIGLTAVWLSCIFLRKYSWCVWGGLLVGNFR